MEDTPLSCKYLYRQTTDLSGLIIVVTELPEHNLFLITHASNQVNKTTKKIQIADFCVP